MSDPRPRTRGMEKDRKDSKNITSGPPSLGYAYPATTVYPQTRPQQPLSHNSDPGPQAFPYSPGPNPFQYAGNQMGNQQHGLPHGGNFNSQSHGGMQPPWLQPQHGYPAQGSPPGGHHGSPQGYSHTATTFGPPGAFSSPALHLSPTSSSGSPPPAPSTLQSAHGQFPSNFGAAGPYGPPAATYPAGSSQSGQAQRCDRCGNNLVRADR